MADINNNLPSVGDDSDSDDSLSFETFMKASSRFCREIARVRWNEELSTMMSSSTETVNPEEAIMNTPDENDQTAAEQDITSEVMPNLTFPMIPGEADIKKLFECPVCYETILPPIILCEGGHSVCYWCKRNLSKCPFCRGDFTNIRNRFAENFLEKCQVRCRFIEAGCNVVLNGQELATHQQEACDFRPILCDICEKEVPYETFLDHLKNPHNLPPRRARKLVAGFNIEELEPPPYSGGSWEPIWIQSFSHDFFCLLHGNGDSRWWIWVTMFASTSVCKDFSFSISILNQEKEPTNFSFTGKVHPFRTSAEEVFQTGRCISFVDSDFTDIMVNKGIDVVIQIHRFKLRTDRAEPVLLEASLEPEVTIGRHTRINNEAAAAEEEEEEEEIAGNQFTDVRLILRNSPFGIDEDIMPVPYLPLIHYHQIEE